MRPCRRFPGVFRIDRDGKTALPVPGAAGAAAAWRGFLLRLGFAASGGGAAAGAAAAAGHRRRIRTALGLAEVVPLHAVEGAAVLGGLILRAAFLRASGPAPAPSPRTRQNPTPRRRTIIWLEWSSLVSLRGMRSEVPILAQPRRVTTARSLACAKISRRENGSAVRSFIRGSASRRNRGALFNPRGAS